MLIILLNVGLLLLTLLIIFMVVRKLDYLSNSETTTGKVVDRGVVARLGMEVNQHGNLSSENRDKGQTYTIVEFTTKEGIVSKLDHTNIGVSIGDELTVRYDPRDPNKAFVDSLINQWIQVMLLGTVLFVLLIARFVLA